MLLWRLRIRQVLDRLSGKYISRLLIFLAIFITVSSALFVYGYADRPGPLREQEDVIIPKGKSVYGIAKILEGKQIILHPELFSALAYIFQKNESLKAGEYRFSPQVTPKQVLKILDQGNVIYRRLTVPEGATTAEALTTVNTTDGPSGVVSADIAEGSLLPETYFFSHGDPRDYLIERMQRKQQDLLDDLWPRREVKHRAILNSQKKVIILASIVEKETAMDEERGKVASVFLNRLHKKMKLQSDPTVIYGITMGEKKLDRELTKKDLETNTPFNTYQRYGLPPTPICNPGRKSIEAVLNPPETEDLYFVADGQGGHLFAKTLKEHNRNVKKYRERKKQ